MKHLPVGTQVALSIVQGCLVASIQADLYDDLLMRIRKGVLDKVHGKTVKGVILDMSAVRVMDSHAFNHLAETARMTALLGVKTLFFGFNPGVVSVLVDLEVDATAIRTFRSIDDAIEHLAGCPVPQENNEEQEKEDHLDLEEDEQEEEM